MRPQNNIDKLIKKLDLKASADLNKKIHSQIDNTLAEQKDSQPAQQLNIWRIIMKSKPIRFAAAAVILVMVSLFLTLHGIIEQPRDYMPPNVASNPSEMMTMKSLAFAYRRGGVGAVEEMCDKAYSIVGPWQTTISIQELFEESNNQD